MAVLPRSRGPTAVGATFFATRVGVEQWAGAATTNVDFEGTATGTVTVTGTGTGAAAFAGLGGAGVEVFDAAHWLPLRLGPGVQRPSLFASQPVRVYQLAGTGSTNLAFAGTGSGLVKEPDTATGVLSFAGTAAGTVKLTGTAAGSLSFSASASATVRDVDAAIGSLAFAGTATGVVRFAASGSGMLGFAGTATGSVLTVVVAYHVFGGQRAASVGGSGGSSRTAFRSTST